MTFEERIKEYLEQVTKATKELHEAYEKEKAEKEYKKLLLATMYDIFALPNNSVLKQELIKACADRIAKVLSEHKAVYIDTDALVKATEGMEDTIDMLADSIIKLENAKSEAALWKKKYRETVDEVKRINDQLNALCKALFKMLP